MDWSEIKGKWHQMAGQVNKRFGKLTSDDVKMSEGNREMLIGRLQERYGYTREVAEQELSRFFNEHYTGLSNPASSQGGDEVMPTNEAVAEVISQRDRIVNPKDRKAG